MHTIYFGHSHSPSPPSPLTHPRSTPTFHSLPTSCPLFLFLTHWVQFALPIYSYKRGTIHWSVRPSTFWHEQFFINLAHERRLPYPVGQYCIIKSLYMYLPCPYHERCFLSWILNKIKCWQNKLIWRVTQDISKRARIGGICTFRGSTHLGVVICNVVSGIQMQVSHMPKLPCWLGRKYW